MTDVKNNRCIVCGGKIVSEEDLTICEYCNNIYHKICWQQVSEECIYCNNKINKISNNLYKNKLW
ncbi:MAG: RING finger protein [Terrisporobacter sp.]|uniref:RING finger protein n=1 Tax=Terrisporobacter sp. TaxID=1965305 RepID=UPI002FC6FA91